MSISSLCRSGTLSCNWQALNSGGYLDEISTITCSAFAAAWPPWLEVVVHPGHCIIISTTRSAIQHFWHLPDMAKSHARGSTQGTLLQFETGTQASTEACMHAPGPDNIVLLIVGVCMLPLPPLATIHCNVCNVICDAPGPVGHLS